MAFARQCGANFIRVKGQERLGRSIANVRDVFSKVKAAAPVVFYIDQIDFIAPTAGKECYSVNGSKTSQLLSLGVLDGVFLQVLNELDKLGQATVFIIGSTYRCVRLKGTYRLYSPKKDYTPPNSIYSPN